jgi:hypothetical protein
MKKTFLTVLALAAACLMPSMAAAQPDGDITRRDAVSVSQIQPAAAVAAPVASNAYESVTIKLAYFEHDAAACMGGKTPSPKEQKKKPGAGGKKKCMTASGPGDGDEEKNGVRRLLT